MISETAWKGWRACIDGRRVQTQNAVYVPRRTPQVRLVYWPESFVIGRAITFVTLAVLIVFAFARKLQPLSRPLRA